MKSLVIVSIFILSFSSCIGRKDHRSDTYILHRDTVSFPYVTGEEETLAKSMLDLRRAGDKEIKTLFNQPFWLLRTPIKDTPVKSTLFDPTIIDRFGKMHIDWSDPNIFRGVVYPTLIGTGLYGTQEK